MATPPPKLFISYSHDSQSHKDWVLTLATRLVANGVDVVLDQWDLTLGSDLPRFMEGGLTQAERVLAICTEAYVEKANRGKGGVGYEKMILTAQLIQDVSSDRIVAVVRSGVATPPVPTFLSSRVYIDFRDDLAFEGKYGELIRDLHGQKISPRPPLGSNPFEAAAPAKPPIVSFGPERYVAPPLRGRVSF
ncbi:MAG: toll/interleukin-1 receptor domain-containing protein, partial [Lautropia sp.]